MAKRRRKAQEPEIGPPIARPLPPGIVQGRNAGIDAEAYSMGQFLAVRDTYEGRRRITLVHPWRRPTVDEGIEAMDALYPSLQMTMGIMLPPKGERESTMKPNTLEMRQITAVKAKRVVDHSGRQIGREFPG